MKTYKCIELVEGKKSIGKQDICLIKKLTATDNTGKTYRLGLPIPESKIKPSEQYLIKVYILVNDFCVPFGTYRTLERTIKTIHINNIEECFKKLSEGLN